MEELALVLPAMWADHHVLAVRDVLSALPGVGHVDASARDFGLRVAFDPAATDAAAITAALTGAGYRPGDLPAGGEPQRDKPAWASAGSRTTTTNQADLAMSGDHRKY
ncbi:MAG TPA: hypothetical protein VK576_04710 [Thermoleophilia bacterium]|nr:hypothetical protein [Thermoleophilia bacterium]